MSAPAAPATGAPATPAGNAWMAPLLILVIGAFMAILDSSIVNVAIPDMMNIFGVDQAKIEWVATAYTLALGVITPLSGWLGNRMGLKNMYLWALVIFTIGSVLCALSWSLNSMIVFRIVQAIGGGLIMPAVQGMMIRMVPRNQMGAASGIFGMAILLAPAIGPTIGGYLVEFVDWRWIFTINLPIGVVGAILAMRRVPSFPGGAATRFDFFGAITIAVSLFTLLLATSEQSSWGGWGAEPVVLLLFTSFISMVAFIWWELSIPEPLLNLRLFKYTTFSIANILLMLISISLFGVLFYLPVYLQTIRGLGAFESGVSQLFPALLTGAVMPFAGRLYDRIGPKILIPIGLVLVAYGMFLFRHLTVDTPMNTIILWNCVRSIGMGLAMIPTQSAAMSEIPAMQSGQASAITNVINRLGGAFGIVIMVQLFDHYNHLQTAGYVNLIQQGDPVRQNIIQQGIQALQARGMSFEQARLVYMSLWQREIGTTAFTNTFDIVMVVVASALVVCAGLALFLKKGKVAEGEPAHVME